MRIRFSSVYIQALSLILFIFLLLFSGCRRTQEEQPLRPQATHPLARDYIGFAVINASFVHLLSEPGPDGISQAYLRRGTVLHIVERRQIINREITEIWILAENQGDGQRSDGSFPRGWLAESLVEIYDSESRANTAARSMLR
ncbi:MAG: hypothetical protein FWH19_03665 [Treponema sp.]|nr:hypothetical protein [Treponema sp.]